jgi:hypothetical protein
MAEEAGANPIEALEGGELAEALAEAMAGLADMFDLIMEDAESVANRDEVQAALRSFKEEYSPAIVEVQEHGLQLAGNIQAGAAEVAVNDLQAASEYETPWDLEINF